MLKGEGGGEAGPRGWWCWALVAGGAGSWWLVLWGLCRHSWLVVWGPHRRSSVVVCWAFVAISGWWCGALVCHSWCWALIIFHGWRAGHSSHCSWMVVVALVALFLGGGGGAPSLVFVPWCVALATLVVVLSLFKGEGGGWSFMFADAPSVVVLHWHRVILHRFCVLSSHVLAMLLSPALFVIVPCRCCCRALIVTCCCNDDAQR